MVPGKSQYLRPYLIIQHPTNNVEKYHCMIFAGRKNAINFTVQKLDIRWKTT
jgi:hypothetical protein